MSLIRQVWLLLVGTVLVALLGSIAVNVLSMRQALQTQLVLKSNDNAQALAIALSQQRGDKERMALLIAAQFDTGDYERITFTDADGKVLFERFSSGVSQHAPRWFTRLLPIESVPGVAQVSDGWQAVGAVTVVSRASFAHDALWRSSVESAALLLVIAAIAGVGGTMLVQGIRRPLDETVAQAQAIVQGRFFTVPEPRAAELARLTRAMNVLVTRLKNLFEAQAAQMEALRQQAHHDALTGLPNRRHFLRRLDAALEREDGPVEGGLVLLRLRDPAEANRLYGHEAVDRAILTIAQALHVYPGKVGGCFLGRLNGADFALCLPVAGVAEETGQALAQALAATLPAYGSTVSVVIGSVDFRRGLQSAQWMSAADEALARAESGGPFTTWHNGELRPDTPVRGERAWRSQIVEAVHKRRAKLLEFRMVDRNGRLLHLECPLRLQLERDEPFEPASIWLPHALRGRITADIDALAVELALQAIEADEQPRCVNVAPASLADIGFVQRLADMLQAQPRAAKRLSVDVAEAVAIDNFNGLQAFGRQLRPLGIRLGLEHAGERLARVDRLYEAGLDHVKLDSSVTRGVGTDAHTAEFIRTTVTLLRALSLQIHAEGVADAGDAQALWACGVDGITGPWVEVQAVPA
jgi:diguanylate cyclase (GGDEF)-like protein